MASKGIEWDDKRLRAELATMNAKIDRALIAVVEYEAPRAEAKMKTGASWTDRTGNARSGLNAQAYHGGGSYGINLSHAVSYGIWLEVRFSGRYAIINPTVQSHGPEVMRTASLLLSRIT